ncbi:MAG: MBL fold metallo-hydrolase [Chloroflexi bacterium]|nr:MBL fold metallo-hydrolase [Chloroflexota bacterium]
MKLKWLGHSCFLITSETGLRIITDPYPQGSGLNYSPINEAADIVTVSHDHFDHNNISAVSGKPEVITGNGVKNVKGIQFKGIATHHDESQGKERGTNTIFCFSVDGIKLCHLGDLGHRLSKEQIAEIGALDILFIPIGGVFTIDAKMASTVSDDLKPKVVIPMHCKTHKCDWPLNTIEDFLAGKKNVKKLNSSETEFKAGRLPEATEIMVLQPA